MRIVCVKKCILYFWHKIIKINLIHRCQIKKWKKKIIRKQEYILSILRWNFLVHPSQPNYTLVRPQLNATLFNALFKVIANDISFCLDERCICSFYFWTYFFIIFIIHVVVEKSSSTFHVVLLTWDIIAPPSACNLCQH